MFGTSTLALLPAFALAFAPGDGERVVSTVETSTAIVFTVDGAKLRDYVRKITDTRTYDARPIEDAKGARSAEVTYGECTSVVTDPTGENRRALPIERRRFRVAPAADPAAAGFRVLEIVPGDKEQEATTREAKEEDAALVVRDAHELLVGGRLAQLLPKEPLQAGPPIEVPTDVANALLDGVLEGATVTRFTLTPKPAGPDGDRANRAAFAAALTVTTTTGKQNGDVRVESTLELAGEIVLGRPHGRIVALDLSGPIRLAGARASDGPKIEVSGTGTLTWTYRAEPLVAAAAAPNSDK